MAKKLMKCEIGKKVVVRVLFLSVDTSFIIYKAFFVLHINCRSGQISVDELQRALSNGTWNPFNPETCRLMIGRSTVPFPCFY